LAPEAMNCAAPDTGNMGKVYKHTTNKQHQCLTMIL
jgi:hypothetical protein